MKFLFFSLFLLAPLCVGAEEMGEKLYAVHATDLLPQENSLHAGLSRKPFSDEVALSLYPDLRNTVHFALGEVVRPIQLDDGTVFSWEDKKCAFVTPLKTLLPQLINLNTYDTFTFGSVAVDETFTLIAPESERNQVPVNHTYAVWTYDPRVEKIRDAVDRFIQEKGGWSVKMVDNHSEKDLSPAFCRGEDINKASFFAVYKERFPYISIVGLRWDTFEGEGYLFGHLETQGFSLIKYLLSGAFGLYGKAPLFTEGEFAMRVGELQEVLHKLDAFVAKAPYTQEQKWEYLGKRHAIETWMTIFACEIQLNQEGYTLRNAPPHVWKEIDGKRNSPKELEEFVFNEFKKVAA